MSDFGRKRPVRFQATGSAKRTLTDDEPLLPACRHDRVETSRSGPIAGFG
jgi:hypothetical protein